MATLVLPRGEAVTYDDEDQELVASHKWWAFRPHKSKCVYVVGKLKRRRIFLHRVLLDAPPHLTVDHRDGDGLNNRRSNLRLATHTDQNRNQGLKSTNTTGFRGVWPVRNRWRAGIHYADRNHYLGTRDTIEEAARLYDAAARQHHGSFARVNFPEPGERGVA